MSRRLARETALQVLYQVDVTGDKSDIEAALKKWGEEFAVPQSGLTFAHNLIRGTLELREQIDERLNGLAKGWSIERMATVDRNLLRLAVYEILYCDDIPDKVSVNEAIELAKSFGGQDSAKFVNGILDQLIADREK